MQYSTRIVPILSRIALLTLISFALYLSSALGEKPTEGAEQQPPRQASQARSQSKTIQLTPRVRYRRIQPGSQTRLLLSRARTAGRASQASFGTDSRVTKMANGISYITIDPFRFMSYGVLRKTSHIEHEVACTDLPEATLQTGSTDPKGGRQ